MALEHTHLTGGLPSPPRLMRSITSARKISGSMVGDVGDDQVVFLTEQLTRALSERSSRSGGRTVVVVPIDQRTLDAGRAALGDSLEKEMALWVARAVAGWKVREDRKAGLIDVHGKRAT
jgi:hypothetical protein